MTPAEIRRRILTELYKFYKATLDSTDLKTLTKNTGVKLNDVKWNIKYLNQRGLVDWGLRNPKGFIEDRVKLNSNGVDLIENPSEFNRQFPDVNVTVNITVETFLVSIREQLDRTDMPTEEKESILSAVKDFASNPLIAPLVGNAVFKVLGIG